MWAWLEGTTEVEVLVEEEWQLGISEQELPSGRTITLELLRLQEEVRF